jgi:hypothetical protein
MITDKQIEQLVEDTIKWANDLSEVWTNTTTGNMIDRSIQHVTELKQTDLNLAHIAAMDLAELCDYAEKVDNE